MDAASLIQLAKAKGIDFTEVAGAASDLDGIAQKRRLTRAEIKHRNEMKLSLDVEETVRGRQSRVYRRPAWSTAELGQAAKGLGLIPWTAALYSFAGAQNGYSILKDALSSEALRLAKREHWPSCVMRRNVRWVGMLDSLIGDQGQSQNYKEDLAELVLTEDAYRHLFLAAPTLYHVYMEVTPEVWERQLKDPFRALKGSYERWLDIARSVIGRWIREPSHSEIVDKSEAS
jgi:hypothetical protein